MKAFPPAKYFWQFENGTRTKNGPRLEFRSAVRRTDGGTYTCTAFNDLGNIKEQSRKESVFNLIGFDYLQPISTYCIVRSVQL